MPSRWFNLPETTETDELGETTYKPAHADQADAYVAFVIADSPRYVVRCYADETTLDAIGNESQATELSSGAALNYLNNARDYEFTEEEMDASFEVR